MIQVKSYTSPTLVLLAFNWEPGAHEKDFLGFAIERSPGFDGHASSWLPNRIGFNGPAPDNQDFPSNTAPIQKFYWWDARIDTKDRGTSFTYRITPMGGQPSNPTPMEQEQQIIVPIPQVE